MTGTFASLNIGKTGLQYQQVAIDVADNNISNVNTDGYVRRRAVGAEIGGVATPTMWSTYTGHGDGVTTESVQRLSDALLDSRVRREHGNSSFLQVQVASLGRVETAIGEPSDTGVAQALADFQSSWQDLASNPQLQAARESVIAKGATLAQAISTQARAIDAESSDLRVNTTNDVARINDDATQLAQLNHNIFVAQQTGTDVSDLMDKRDQLALDLSNLSGAVTAVGSDGRYNVTVNGVALVTGDTAGSISVKTGIDASGNSDGQPLAFQITSPGAGSPTDVGAGMSGELGGIMTLQNVTLATYRAGLNQVTKTLADEVNAQQTAGYDLNGAAGTAFFSYNAADPAGTIQVALTSGSQVAASSDPTKALDGSNADAITQVLQGQATAAVPTPADVSDSYQTLISGLGATVSGINNQAANQLALANQVDDEREQMAGVSIDEETINLMAAQRAYEASSRVLTTMNSVLDTLINRMGVN